MFALFIWAETRLLSTVYKLVFCPLGFSLFSIDKSPFFIKDRLVSCNLPRLHPVRSKMFLLLGKAFLCSLSRLESVISKRISLSDKSGVKSLSSMLIIIGKIKMPSVAASQPRQRLEIMECIAHPDSARRHI